jgi:hypothetical protein
MLFPGTFPSCVVIASGMLTIFFQPGLAIGHRTGSVLSAVTSSEWLQKVVGTLPGLWWKKLQFVSGQLEEGWRASEQGHVPLLDVITIAYT